MVSERGDRSQNAGPFGRGLRIALGVILLGSVAGFYLRGTGAFVIRSLAVTVGLVVVYVLLHRLASAGSQRMRPSVGAIVALAPLVLVYALGTGGGLIFGNGEGQLGALTFLAVSLVLAGLRGDAGCEVMALPGAFYGRKTPLACLFFSPIDRLEHRLSRNREARP